MDVFRAAEKLMAMDDDAWARHANPWSGWSRLSCIPLLALAVWSRAWIGWWSLIPIGLAIAWTWLNPRLFGPPKSLDNWMSRGVLGERIFLARKKHPIPAHHERAGVILAGMSAPGVVILLYGLLVLDGRATLCGAVLTALPKLWFLDRMVWLQRDMEKQKKTPGA